MHPATTENGHVRASAGPRATTGECGWLAMGVHDLGVQALEIVMGTGRMQVLWPGRLVAGCGSCRRVQLVAVVWCCWHALVG